MVCPWGMGGGYQGRWMVVQALKGGFWEFGFWISWISIYNTHRRTFAILSDFSWGDVNKHQLTAKRAPDIRPKKWFDLSFVCWSSEFTGLCYKNKTTATTLTKNMDEVFLAAAWVRNSLQKHRWGVLYRSLSVWDSCINKPTTAWVTMKTAFLESSEQLVGSYTTEKLPLRRRPFICSGKDSVGLSNVW